MSKPNVALSSLVTQAWDQLQGQVLKEIRQRIEELAEAERETRLGRARHARGGASPWRRWGYRVRKVLLTPWKRRGFTQALRQVVIDDGDPWIWKISEEVFPQALQIVDRYHVKEHLSQLAKALYRQVETAHRWAQRRHQELDEGRWRSLSKALVRHAARSLEARNCLQYVERKPAPHALTQNFVLNTAVLPREYWRPDVRWSSGHD